MKQEHGWKVPNKNVTLRFSIGSDEGGAPAHPQQGHPQPHQTDGAIPIPPASVQAAPQAAPAQPSMQSPWAQPAPAPQYAAYSPQAPQPAPYAAPHVPVAPPQAAPLAAPVAKSNEEDIRVKLLGTIWGCATGMLGICIPLVAITQSGPALPLAVAAGAAISSVAVLNHFKGSASSASATQDATQAARLHELEERLANMETINSFERRLAEDALARDRADVPTAPIARDVAAPAETTYHFLEPEATQTAR